MFSHLIAIQPLGLLYGSAGGFLSPENLVGRSGTHFPPSTATLSGIFAAEYGNDAVQNLQLAGPFWGKSDEVLDEKNQDFYVPTPLNYLVKPDPEHDSNDRGKIKTGTIEAKLSCEKLPCKLSSDPESHLYVWSDKNNSGAGGKPVTDTWLALSEWDDPKTVKFSPWQFLPHLHPRLKHDERHVATPDPDNEDENQGSLFLENSVQMHPDTCLVYLANMEIPPGWYRFGGEGHLVEVSCLDLAEKHRTRLAQPLSPVFATIVPAVWGSNRLSRRYPEAWEDQKLALFTQRPIPFRYRLGGKGNVKHLSRGRYAVPAGTVYVMQEPFPPWQDWEPELFPKEGPYLKRWGCGLALSLPPVV
jgi:CRISPR-associated protein Cmr3